MNTWRILIGWELASIHNAVVFSLGLLSNIQELCFNAAAGTGLGWQRSKWILNLRCFIDCYKLGFIFETIGKRPVTFFAQPNASSVELSLEIPL